MTDTTDIKALREAAIKSKDSSGIANYRKGDEAKRVFNAMLSEDLIIKLLDQLKAERQRAAGSEEELHKALHREKAAERKLLAAQEEIAELKGEQVPVAITDDMAIAFHAATTDSALAQDDMEEIKAGLQAVKGLFADPKKPVVPVGFLFVVKATGAVIYSIADAAIEGTQLIGQIYGDAAIEAAGGVVKDGE